MEQGRRVVRYDPELGIEGYAFEGVIQIFPGHFHEYYMVGFIEKGLQHMKCRQADCTVEGGDLLLFNPGDVHSCRPADGRSLDYRGFNIPKEVMLRAAREISGGEDAPYFTEPAVFRSPLVPPLRAVHTMVMDQDREFGKEEGFLLLLGQLLTSHAGEPPAPVPGEAEEAAAAVCAWIEAHSAEHITLDQLSALAGWNKYRLIRAFTRARGITPYGYLTTVRVGRAKGLLERGASPLDAALECGFCDQSHFTNQFKKLIGLTPGQYAAIFQGGGGHG